MAAVAPLPQKVDSLSKAVQELAIKDTEPPEKYVIKDARFRLDDSLPVMDIPEVDLGLLISSSPAGEEELKKLQASLSSSGYIQAVNHGIEASFLDKVHEITSGFYSLPMEEKKKWAKSDDDLNGYGNDPVYPANQTLDWNDRLTLIAHPEDQRKPDKWPQNPKNFSEILLEFTEKLRKINEVILKAMAKSFNLKENCFLKQFGENPTVVARLNLYPPCPRPDLVLALKAHGDASGTTFLLQDKEVEGLQALKDGQWYRVPIIPQAIVVNLGDQVEIMSNGIFKSPIHRAVTNKERTRITTAIFFTPEPTVEVGPVEGLINEQRPRLYKNITDYTSKFFKFCKEGKRPIDALRI